MGTKEQWELFSGVGGTMAADDGLNGERKHGLGERGEGETAGRAEEIPVLWVATLPATETVNGATASFELALEANIVASQM